MTTKTISFEFNLPFDEVKLTRVWNKSRHLCWSFYRLVVALCYLHRECDKRNGIWSGYLEYCSILFHRHLHSQQERKASPGWTCSREQPPQFSRKNTNFIHLPLIPINYLFSCLRPFRDIILKQGLAGFVQLKIRLVVWGQHLDGGPTRWRLKNSLHFSSKGTFNCGSHAKVPGLSQAST